VIDGLVKRLDRRLDRGLDSLIGSGGGHVVNLPRRPCHHVRA
jgi:hypothetical protein